MLLHASTQRKHKLKNGEGVGAGDWLMVLQVSATSGEERGGEVIARFLASLTNLQGIDFFQSLSDSVPPDCVKIGRHLARLSVPDGNSTVRKRVPAGERVPGMGTAVAVLPYTHPPAKIITVCGFKHKS